MPGNHGENKASFLLHVLPFPRKMCSRQVLCDSSPMKMITAISLFTHPHTVMQNQASKIEVREETLETATVYAVNTHCG